MANEDDPRISFNFSDTIGRAIFRRVCNKCGRFVSADSRVYANDFGLRPGPNATCSRCGRVEMEFEGFF